MCIDLSESLNKFLYIPKVQMDDIKIVLNRIQQNSFFASFDLKGMYHQCFLEPDITDFFGFAVKEIDGSESYYKYLRLPFGTATAVFITDQLMSPLKAFCHKHSVDVSIYIGPEFFSLFSKLLIFLIF